jgi:hypothetical protein
MWLLLSIKQLSNLCSSAAGTAQQQAFVTVWAPRLHSQPSPVPFSGPYPAWHLHLAEYLCTVLGPELLAGPHFCGGAATMSEYCRSHCPLLW